jgi:hypothetical protein
MWAYSMPDPYFNNEYCILVYPEEGSSNRIRNVGNNSPTYTALYSFKLESLTNHKIKTNICPVFSYTESIAPT